MTATKCGPSTRSPNASRTPQDLTAHAYINLRLPTRGGRYAWEFVRGGRAIRIRGEGQLVFNGTTPMIDAALAAFGPACAPKGALQSHRAEGRLIRVGSE